MPKITRKTVKQRLWKTLNIIVGVTTILNVSMVGSLIAPKVANAATTLSTQILSWNIIGLDSNNPVTDGPHKFLIQARVTNTGASAAAGVQTSFAFGAGQTCNGSPTSCMFLDSAASQPLNSIAPGASKDVFYVIRVTPPPSPNTPSNAVFGKTRPFTITTTSPDAPNTSAGQTLLIEKILSQSRNSIISSSIIPPNPLVGEPFVVHVEYETSTTYPHITPQMTYNPSSATLDSVTTNYVDDGAVETDIYAQNHGNVVHSDFHFRAQAAGNLNFFYTVLDNSGGSYHYNADSSNAIVVPVDPRQNLEKTVNKTTANPGEQITYTLSYFNTGNIDLTNVVITETYSPKFTFGSSIPVPSSGNNVWNIGNLPVATGGQISITGTLTGPFSAGNNNVHNVAVMTSNQTPPVQDTADTTVTATCTLTITKAVDKATALPGDQLTYTLTYANTGNANCTGGGVRIDDVTPANTTYVSGSNTQQASNDTDGQGVDFGYDHDVFGSANPAGYNPTTKLLSWDAEIVSPGESGTITYKVTVDNLPVCTTTNIDNTAKAYADQVPNGVTSNQVRTVVTTPCNGNLVVNKYFDDNGDGQVDRTNPQGWTWDVTNGSQNNVGGANLSLAQASYTITEDAIANHSSTWTCSNQTSGNGTSFNANVVANQTLTCSFTNTRDTGSVTVTKKLDADGNGSFETTNPADWTWTLDAGSPRVMGSTATLVPTGNHSVNENSIAGFHFVGWYPTASTQYSCANPQGTSLPVSIEVTKGQTTSITLCNARDTGSLIVNKEYDDNGDGQVDRTNPQGWTWNIVNGLQDNAGGATVSLPTGPYTVTEDANVGYTATWTCSNQTNGNGTSIGVSVTTNQQLTCTFRNTRDLGTLVVHKNVLNPDGGEVADTHSFTITVSGQSDGTIAEGTDATYLNLPTGTYTVIELPDGNYDFVSYSIDNDGAAGAQVTVSKNATTHLTVTNKQKKATIDVLKDVRDYLGNDTTDNTAFQVDWNNGSFNIAENAAGQVVVNPGTYTFTEIANPNYTTQQNQFEVTVTSNETKSITFVNWQKPSSISGYKFDDLNGNGTWDQGEPGLPNWTIQLYDNGNLIATDVTDGTGAYSFENLTPKTYVVSEFPQAGWMQTYPVSDIHQVVLGVNDHQANKNFGNFKLGKISGYKFNDLNGNGTWEQDEPALEDWSIQIDSTHAGVAVDTTDVNGYYEFSGLTVGTYNVTEIQQVGWIQTSTNPAPIAVISGTDSQNNNFGNFARGSISGRKFNDLNGNGTWDQGEPTIAGWTIYMNDGDNLSSTQTDGNGVYSFSNLGPDTYTISEDIVSGWIQTFPPQNGTYLITLTSGANVTDKDFGNFQLGKVSGYKFNDLNGNGTWNQGEPGIANWGMTLSDNQQNWNTVTDDSGYYQFTGLMAGTYSVTEENRAGWVATTPTVINGIAVTSGTDSQNNTFGNFQLVSISGQKFNDVNGNGLKDVGDLGLQGWTIKLDMDANGTVDATTVTDADGNFSFSNLGPGTYRLREVQQAGWVQTTVNPADATVTSGTNVSGVDFGNFRLGMISGYKFNDLNGNGTWDNGEPTIAGWTMQLWINGGQIDSTQTDANGLYSFSGLTNGTYTVLEDQEVGWTQTTPNPAPIVVTSGTDSQNNNFGNFNNVPISGYKFNDLNGNGAWDNGEPTIAGWTIYLNDGQNISSTLTDVNGAYAFSNLGPGTYTVSEDHPAGWIQTYPTQPGNHVITPTSGTAETDKNFGNFQLGTISGYKFNDLNGNGAWDNGELGIENWGMTLSDGQSNWNATTDVNGYYEFTGLMVGTYSVTEENRIGWTPTTPASITGISVTSGTNSQNNTFGNFELVSISGSKFNDLNGNGTWDQGEAGLAGWTIELDLGANGSVDQTTLTDANGDYSFSNLGPGTYRLREVQQAGWMQTTANPADVTVTSGTNVSNIDFGNFQLVSISGQKFNDVNGNGLKDVGDLGLQGWTIELDMDANGTVDATTVTDADGNFSFSNLGPGTYRLREVQQTGWLQTTANPADATVTSGTNVSGVDFGNFRLGRIDGSKLDDQQQGLANWTICLWLDQQLVDCTTTDQNGHYSFENLTYGTYTVSETQQYGWTQIAPDGGTYTVLVESGTGHGEESTSYDFVNRLNAFEVNIDKTAPETVQAGGQLTYTLNWTVTGNTPASNVTLVDTLPGNVTFVSASNSGSYDSNTNKVSWNIGNVVPDQNGAFTVTVAVTSPLADGTLLTNTAEICGSADLVVDAEQKEEPTTKCDDDETTTEVESDLAVDLVKTDSTDPVQAGGQLTYTLNWSVSGNAPVNNLVLVDTLPANVTFFSASNGGSYDSNTNKVTWNLGPQLQGSNGSETITVTVASPIVNGTVLTNVAEVCVDSFTRTQEEVLHRCDSDDETTTVSSAPNISIVKSSNVTTFVTPGTVVEYTVTVTNAANATDTARNVVMTDTLPSGFTFAVDGTTTKSFPLGDLAPGQSATVKYLVNISGTQVAGTYNNLAKAKGDNTGEVSATTPIEVRVPQVLGEETNPDLTIVKSAGAKNAKPGDVVTYSITIENVGDGDAENVVITDTLPKDLSFVHSTGRTVTWNIGTLKAGHTRTVNVDVRVESDAKSGTYTNVATVRSDEVPEKSATADLNVKRPVVLGLATTGVGTLDYLIGLIGLAMVALGAIGLRRRNPQASA